MAKKKPKQSRKRKDKTETSSCGKSSTQTTQTKRHEQKVPVKNFFHGYSNFNFSRRQRKKFNVCANLYNLGKLDPDELRQYDNNILTWYFLANNAIVQGDSREGKYYVDEGLKVAKSSPKSDFLRLLMNSPLARILVMNGEFDELHILLQNSLQKIHAAGRQIEPFILGWMHYMCARFEPYSSTAKKHLIKAIDAHNRSKTLDKDFGMAHAMCRLVICILGCGEEANTIDAIETPPPTKIRKAKSYFKQLRKMQVIRQNVVIRIIYLMGRSDFYCRTERPKRALKSAKKAHQIAINRNLLEFKEVTKQRKDVYASKCTEKLASRDRPQNTFIYADQVHIGDIIHTEMSG